MPDFSNFECDNCGACCKHPIVEAGWHDVLREPKVFEIGKVDRKQLRDADRVIVLWDSEKRQCPFLDEDNRCGIYATRPAACVCVEAGDAKCQQSRKMAGLDFLKDRDGRDISVELLIESMDEYGMSLIEDPTIDGLPERGRKE